MPNCDLPKYYALVFTSLIWLVTGSMSKILSLDAKCRVGQIISFVMQVSGRIKPEVSPLTPEPTQQIITFFQPEF